MTRRPFTFEALDNFRDYGGYGRAAGGALRSGRLFRSAHHARLSAADLTTMAGLDLGLIVDLRRPSERRAQPSRRPAGFSGQVLESHADDDVEAPHIAFLKSGRLTADSGRRFMTDIYRTMSFDAAHLDLFGRFFRALGDSERPALIHCAAGKDRTGLLAALTHHLLGVSRDDMVEDFLATNTAVDLAGRAPGIARQIEAMTGHAPSEDAVVAFLGVEPAYLEAAFDAIRGRCGSLDGYLETALGVDGALRDRIAARLSA